MNISYNIYTVNNETQVKEELGFSHRPSELIVELVNTGSGNSFEQGSCRVTPKPTGVYKNGIEVSNHLLEELLEEEAIELQNSHSDDSIELEESEGSEYIPEDL